MGRRSRRRGRNADTAAEAPEAPAVDYPDAEGNVLTLRGSMTAATRRAYREVVSGSPLSREDAWQRSAEFLFERLAVRWTVAGLPLERQDELLGRYRMTTRAERDWVRARLREHLAEHFPELQAP